GSAADGALLPVAFQDRGPHRLPPPESVLLPRPDGDPELLAEDRTVLADGERALVAEPEEAVPVRVAGAERRQRAVKRIKAELQVGGHVRCSLSGYGITTRAPPHCRGPGRRRPTGGG